MNCRDIAELTPLHLCSDLNGARAAAFAAHLRVCPECAQKVKREQYYDARLREIVLSEAADAAPIGRRVRERIASESTATIRPYPVSRATRRLAAIVTGVAAALLLAVVGYHGVLGPHVARVYAAAAEDHRLEVVEQQPRNWLTDPAQIVSLAEQHGIASSSILALAQQGYHLDRAKICLLNRSAFLHLVYAKGAQEFSVYLRAQESGQLPGGAEEKADPKPLYTCGVDSEYVASFQNSRLAVMVVSNQSADAASSFARFASSVL